MQDFGTKADNSPPPGGQLSAAEFNNLATENENAVSRSGQTLSGASATQLATSLFLHAVKSVTFQDSGAANAYVATPVSGASGVLLPADYAAMNGAIVLFKASAANTTASTLNIGQTTGTLLGAKAIVDQAGAALTVGAITASAYMQLRYDSSIGAGSWVLLGFVSLSQLQQNYAWNHLQQIFTASGNFTVPANVYWIKARLWSGGGGGGAGSSGGGAGGAGAGGYAEKIIAVTPGQVIAATIGAGGAINGNNGGSSSFSGMSITGGGGGVNNATGGGGAGGVATGGTINMIGGSGSTGSNSTATAGGSGGCSPGGGGGNGGGALGVAGAGSVPGGAGGGGGALSNGGAGAGGMLIVEW